MHRVGNRRAAGAYRRGLRSRGLGVCTGKGPPPGPPGAAAASVSPLCSGCLVTSEAAVRGSRAFENRVRVGPAGAAVLRAASVESGSPAVGRKHGSSRRERQRRNPKLPAEPELLWRAPSPQLWLDEAGCGQEKQPLETDIGV